MLDAQLFLQTQLTEHITAQWSWKPGYYSSDVGIYGYDWSCC